MGNQPPGSFGLFDSPAKQWQQILTHHRALIPIFLPLPPNCPAEHFNTLQAGIAQHPKLVEAIQRYGHPPQEILLSCLHDPLAKPPGSDGVWLAVLRMGDPQYAIRLLTPPISPENYQLAVNSHPMAASLLAAAGPPSPWVLQQLGKEQADQLRAAPALNPKTYLFASQELSLQQARAAAENIVSDPQWLQRLASDGFAKLPGLVPDELVRAARQHINYNLGVVSRPTAPENLNGSSSAEIEEAKRSVTSAKKITDVFNRSLLGPVCAALMGCGERIVEQHGVQIALRFPGDFCVATNGSRAACDPGTWDGHVATIESYWHFDGCATAEHNHYGIIHNFTMLVGVLLADVPEPLGGELMCYPSSQYALADYFGPGSDPEFPSRLIALRDKGGKEQPNGARTATVFGPTNKFGVPARPRHCTGKAGDVFIANFMTAHGIAPNASPDIRYAIYFRVTSPLRASRASSDATLQGKSSATVDGHGKFYPEAMLDPWLEWPRLHSCPTALRFEHQSRAPIAPPIPAASTGISPQVAGQAASDRAASIADRQFEEDLRRAIELSKAVQ